MRLETVRGTADTFKVYIVDEDGAPYDVADGDSVVFGMKAETDTTPIFIKTANPVGGGIYEVYVNPLDTVNLTPGRYFYDVGVLLNGVPYSAVPFSTIDILDTVIVGGGGGA